MSAFDDYVRMEEELLSKERAGTLTGAEEDRLSDELEHLWYRLSAEEAREMRRRSASRAQDRPVDLGPAPVNDSRGEHHE